MTQPQQNRSGNGTRAGKRKRSRNRKSKAKQNRAFWGDEARLPEPPTRARITEEPASVINSLGRPPMPGFEQQAQHYFEAVTMRAVAIGAAIAAAGDMVDADDL
jgi:hypothetical protein